MMSFNNFTERELKILNQVIILHKDWLDEEDLGRDLTDLELNESEEKIGTINELNNLHEKIQLKLGLL